MGGEQEIWELKQDLSESAHTFLLATIAFRILACSAKDKETIPLPTQMISL